MNSLILLIKIQNFSGQKYKKMMVVSCETTIISIFTKSQKMPIAAHIVRSLAEVLKRERETHSLFLISGMPGVGKTTLVKAVFNDLAYVDLNDIYPRNLARTQPADFFSVYGKRLIVDGIEKAPELTDFLPTDDSSQIVLVGYLPTEKKKLLIEYGGLKCHCVLPFSQREYAQTIYDENSNKKEDQHSRY